MKDLLKHLCLLDAIPGHEQDVRAFIEATVKPYADSSITDVIGNLLVFKKGQKPRKRPLMVTAHMDEVGFYVTSITETGMIKIAQSGDVDPRVLIGKKMRVGYRKIPGVISLKAIHLVSREEEKTAPPLRSLYIDIGADSKAAAESVVNIGEPVCFDSEFYSIGNCVKAKAVDDRIGCAVMIKLLKMELAFDTWFVFSCNKEIGSRGAQIASQRILPGIIIAIEAIPAADIEDIPEHKKSCYLRGGVAFPFLDKGAVYSQTLRRKAIAAVQKAGLCWQHCSTAAGSTDARVASFAGEGALALCLGIPTRYIHTPNSLFYMPDAENLLKAAQIIIEEVGECDV